MRLKHSAEVPRSPPTRENSPSRPLPGRSCCFASNQLSRKRKPVSFATLGIPRIQSFWGTKGSSPYVDSTKRMEEVTDTRGRCPTRTQRCRVHGRMDSDDGDRMRSYWSAGMIDVKTWRGQHGRAPLDRTAEGGCPHMCSALGGGDQAGFAIFDLEVVGIALQTNSVPKLQIQQAPDAVVMVAVLGAVFLEEAFDGGALEKAAIHTPLLQQQLLDCIKLRAGQPAAPGSGEAEFWTIEDRMRKKVFHGLFEDGLARQSIELVRAWNVGGELDQHMIEERHATLDGCGHAHVVLLHQ